MSIEKDKLADVVKRILALEGEKKVLSADIKEIYEEAKDAGADAKVLRKTIALLSIEKDKRIEQLDLIGTYLGLIEE